MRLSNEWSQSRHSFELKADQYQIQGATNEMQFVWNVGKISGGVTVVETKVGRRWNFLRADIWKFAEDIAGTFTEKKAKGLLVESRKSLVGGNGGN